MAYHRYWWLFPFLSGSPRLQQVKLEWTVGHDSLKGMGKTVWIISPNRLGDTIRTFAWLNRSSSQWNTPQNKIGKKSWGLLKTVAIFAQGNSKLMASRSFIDTISYGRPKKPWNNSWPCVYIPGRYCAQNREWLKEKDCPGSQSLESIVFQRKLER